jgi:hypothetical protein
MATSKDFAKALETAAISSTPSGSENGAKNGAASSGQSVATSRRLDSIVGAVVEESQEKGRDCKDLLRPAQELQVARAGNDPATHGFSIRCSTN